MIEVMAVEPLLELQGAAGAGEDRLSSGGGTDVGIIRLIHTEFFDEDDMGGLLHQPGCLALVGYRQRTTDAGDAKRDVTAAILLNKASSDWELKCRPPFSGDRPLFVVSLL